MNDATYMHEIQGFSTNTALFPELQTLGLFEDIDVSFLQEASEEYYMHSSQKRLSPICRKWLVDAVDLTAFVKKIAHALYFRYGTNWASIWNAYFVETYNPIENYGMTETKTPRVETTTTINTATKITNEQEGKVYGFNSPSAVPERDNKVTTTGDADENETTSVTSFDGEDTLTRHGNIGVTTSQQMIQSELDLRKYDFLKSTFADIDRLLCYILESV